MREKKSIDQQKQALYEEYDKFLLAVEAAGIDVTEFQMVCTGFNPDAFELQRGSAKPFTHKFFGRQVTGFIHIYPRQQNSILPSEHHAAPQQN